MNDAPCHGCKAREIGCHSKCAKYEEYRQTAMRDTRENVVGRYMTTYRQRARFTYYCNKARTRGGTNDGGL